MNRYARVAGVIGFVGALGAGALLADNPADAPVTVAAGCPAGQHTTFSKYGGAMCAPDLGKSGHQVATVVTGCVLGAPGGLPGLLMGCAGGGVAVVLDITP